MSIRDIIRRHLSHRNPFPSVINMNARTLFHRGVPVTAWIAIVSLGTFGCTKSAPESEQAYAASGGLPPASASQPGAADLGQPRQPVDLMPTTSPPGLATSARSEQEPLAMAGVEQLDRSEVPSTSLTNQGVAVGDRPAAPDVPLGQLRPDLSPEKLLEFLAGADQDMQLIESGRSGITDRKKARDTLVHIVKMKLEASRRLSNHAEASADARSEGRRGELQAMSHLASYGDLKIANELEKLAKANLTSDDANLVADSRLVLIGFAIEALQHGKPEAADQIVGYVDEIAASETKPDVPAMMVMGQARSWLADNGHYDKARHVRGVILDLFADSPDPEIAKMAASFAGSVQDDEIEQLRADAMDGQTVSTANWRKAIETLIAESADLQTVQYLAGAALEFESIGRDELAKATYDVLAARFDDPQSATGREVQLAIQAREARRDVIGKEFDPDLPPVDGSKISMADYRGKVVLMPFWAMNFPDSLQVISNLQAIRKAHGDKVAIVGVNLDVEGAPVQQFLQTNNLDFPSFRAESSGTAKVANRVAAEFGMVSLPFTAIIDQQGLVSAINFSGRDLEKTVAQLVEP